ncbi:sulfotransferase family protein [Dapis sp. BLCC M126]|uniref:sulfotransferase family protein n=1 Tax=Dapis sp. BLCC M126 TaxID=3400189 RepID=UPI003CE861A1
MTVKETINQFLKNPARISKNIIWRFPKSKSHQRHIFVFGAPRTGTTLMKLILGTHPNLTGPGYETGIFMYKELFSLPFSELTQSEIEDIQKQSQDIVDYFDRLAECTLKKIGGTRFIEKTPPHVLRIDFLAKYFPNAQFINMYRDGRDCYCSARNHVNVVQGKTIERYARYWKKCVDARLRSGNLPNILDIKYEDLTLYPETVVKQTMNFLQEDYYPSQVDSTQYSKNTITNSKRQEFSQLSKPINSSRINRYKQELTSEQINKFNQIAGNQLKQIGYDV